MGNLACHESLVNAISMQNGLITTVVDQLFLDDSACLSETFRFLAAILRSSASVSWAEALLPDEILSHVLWIVGNTLNSTLLEKSIDFLSTVIDNQDVTAILLQPLIKMGLVDHVISLLASEIEKISDESKFDRVICNRQLLEVMSSSDQLIQVLDKIIKLPDKIEVSSYCASVVMILANLLADGKHIVPSLSHGGSDFMKNASYHMKITFVLSQYFGLFVLSDLPFLEGLFDILPLVCDDNQARNALWCILARLLAQAQGIDMNSSSLKHFVSLLLGKFTLIKDDLESHRVDKEMVYPHLYPSQ
ncbi:protein saal1 [Panicum miliaceum]|uniref:Protein saal1 n=1 Tax=Panicum miliaceum TaxID=4540 RepID=A0A3L6TSX5_PANMI|nr:protein saal1 [Panicum miliaceum]